MKNRCRLDKCTEMNNHRGICLLLLFMFLFPVVYSQQNQQKFRHLSIDDGLSHNTVNCVIKDSRGYLWIGTNDGLNRYDGYGFNVYKHDYQDDASLSNNSISCLFEDSNHDIWIGTRGGLNRYNPNLNRFYQFRHDPDDDNSMGHDFIRAILEDSRGTLWVGTWGGGLQIAG